MDLTWDLDREEGVSLVRCRVCNDDAVPRRVRIESLLDAPVLPPRRGGVPEDGWDESGVTLRLDPGERRAIGFAARGPPAEPPVEIAEVAAVDPTAESKRSEPATAAALRRLEDHRPPEAAVTGGADGSCGAGGSSGAGGLGDVADTDASDVASRTDEPESGEDGPAPPSIGTGERFDAVGRHLDAVEARIDRAERLTDADLATATAAVAETDGIAEFSGLDERVDADEARLRALSERASTLAARAEATDAPVGALERLA